MKRFHVHVSVDDLAASIRFYSTVFGTPPTVEKSDYAKWMIEDPRINFAISQRGRKAGVNHLGIQVDSDEELAQLRQQVARADVTPLDQRNGQRGDHRRHGPAQVDVALSDQCDRHAGERGVRQGIADER